MKNLAFAATMFCVLSASTVPRQALADAPLPGQMQVFFANNSVTLGEPLVLKYKITNVKNHAITAYMGREERNWTKMTLVDASGQPVLPISVPPPIRNGIYTDGIGIGANNVGEGNLVVSRQFQPTRPGVYRLKLSTHLVYSWDDESRVPTADDQTVDDKTFTIALTILPRDPEKLLAVAQGLRQEVVDDKNVANRQLALQTLFTMRDPVCLPVWRAVAIDPSLDASRAVEVARYLGDVETTNAADILAAMQTVKPERWSQVGRSPQDAMQRMQMFAAPDVKQHLAQLLPEPVPLRRPDPQMSPE